MELLGKSLPATVVSRQGGIVTVKFEVTGPYTLPNVTVPMIGSEYIRLPIQPGCPGWLMTADAYLGGMSGLGGGTADLSLQGNLSALVWSPIGNKVWQASGDDNAVVIYGPDGVVLRSVTAGSAKVTVTPTVITLAMGAISVVINATDITLNGPVVFNGVATGTGGIVDFGSSTLTTTGTANVGSLESAAGITSASKNVGSTHVHSGVTTGGGDTGVPV
jgi:hypothetical protein